ncbi:MAG: hypothetical protein R3F08_04160 [Dokdonella sp.]
MVTWQVLQQSRTRVRRRRAEIVLASSLPVLVPALLVLALRPDCR